MATLPYLYLQCLPVSTIFISGSYKSDKDDVRESVKDKTILHSI